MKNLKSSLLHSSRQGLMGGFASANIFNEATLDLNFAKYKTLGSKVTHTRASNATYVGGDGLIKDATTNLALYSEEFDQSYWQKGFSSIVPNQATAPNNTFTADKLVEDSTTQEHYLWRLEPVTAGVTYTKSCYVKAAERSVVSIKFSSYNSTFANENVSFDLSTGSVIGTPSAELVDYDIHPVGNGWYRIYASATAAATSSTINGIVYLNNGSTFYYTGDGTSGVYIWGAQLEQSSTVGEYVKTTSTINSAPRFDHDPETGESLGLLVEEERTNSIRNNTMVGAVAGTPGTLPTNWIGAGSQYGIMREIVGTGIDNGIHYFDLRLSGTASSNYISIFSAEASNAISATQNDVWTASVYTKLQSGSLSGVSSILLRLDEINSSSAFISGATETITPTSADLIDQRTTVTKTFSDPSVAYAFSGIRIQINSGNTVDFTLRIGLPQLEKGAFATSVIRTSGSTVTRAADITQISGNDFGTFNLLEYSEEFDQSYWSKTNATVVTNSIANPLTGKFTADKLVATANSGSHFINRSITSSANSTVSVYAKAAGYNYIEVNGYTDSVNQNRVTVNLTNGNVANNTNSLPVLVTSAGNGWYRIAVTLTNGGSYVTFAISTDGTVNQTFTGDGTSGVYIWGAQLEESSTATPYVKSDVTWASRGSNATYYDKDGVLRKSSYNLLTYSEEFDQADWSTLFSASLTANQTEAPTGTLTADQLTISNSNAYSGVRQNYTFLASTTYTFSCWVRAVSGTASFRLKIYDGVADTFSSNQSATETWQRFTLTMTTASGAAAGNVAIANITNPLSQQEIYVWGAQLEAGPYAGPYVKTTSSPASSARTNAYLPDGSGNFVSAGELLLEDAGTNFLEYSEKFDNGYWGKVNATIDANAFSAPDGTLTADTLIAAASSGEQRVRQDVTGLSSDTTYTLSVYAKAAGYNFVAINHGNYLVADYLTYFNLSTGTVATNPVGSTATITDVGNGWYRCSVTRTTSSSQTVISSRFYVAETDGVASFTGDGTSGIYIWGAQLEENPYATSYTPTYGSTATRAADVSTSSSNTFGNSFYDQEKGTVFVDATGKGSAVPSSDFHSLASITDGTNSNRIELGYMTALVAHMGIRNSNTLTTNFNPDRANDKVRLAGAFKSNDSALSIDGESPLTDGTVTIPTTNELGIGGSNESDIKEYSGTISRLTYWPTRLSNESLQAITK